jgi:AraC-like DNA-binding protein
MLIDTDDDAGDLGRLREAALAGPAPMDLSLDRPGPGRARLWQDHVADCTVASLRVSGPVACQVRRTPALIRQSDPELVVFGMPTAGFVWMNQDRAQISLSAGQLTIYDTSRPFDGGYRPHDGSLGGGIFVGIPRDRLTTRHQRLRDLTATVLGAPSPLVSLFRAFIRQLAVKPVRYSPAVAANLAGIITDLGTTLLAATEAALPLNPQGQRRILLLQAKAYIDRHLKDPSLSPTTVAEALHVSLRTLYRAFGEQEQPTAAWIRQRRLEHCRRDLTDPALVMVPVHALAARWGIVDASQFNRAFHRAYGLPPHAYRYAILAPHTVV